MFLKSFVFFLSSITFSFLNVTNAQPNDELKENNSFFDYGVKITLTNKDYLPITSTRSLRIGIIDPSTPDNPNVDMNIWYMDLPKNGAANQYCYSGSNSCRLIAYFDSGKVLLALKDFRGLFSDTVKHIFISLRIRNTNKSQFPLVNIRYIDNRSSIESLKFLAAKAVKKFKDHKRLLKEKIESKLPQDLQDYLQEREHFDDLSHIIF